jgi:hypothetical protein
MSNYRNLISRVSLALAALAVLGLPGLAFAQLEAVAPVEFGIDYGTTAGNFGAAVGGVVVAALGFMLGMAVVQVFRRWIGARKS